MIPKICKTCNYKAVTNEDYCPKCHAKGEDVLLDRDYRAGKYGHMVKQ